ncbi:hypothetical protein [Glutamicibacter mishrai]|uniref:hypothetical protein n=1 Tax=Glutamicibacter mishrai TaxID=1775880 RepID=UPI003F7A74ED
MSWIEENAERMYPDSDITYGAGAVREAYAYGANEALKRLAQPVVNSVEEVPAKLQIISWEEEPEHECWKLAPDETFVGLIVKSGRSWTPRDKYTLNIERPEANDA